MKWIRTWLVALMAIAIGFAVYGGLQYYFQPNRWFSVALAILGALYSAAGPTLELVKKAYEIRKLPYELRKLQREETKANLEKNSRIHLPTDAEIERVMAGRFKTSGQIVLNPKPFVDSSGEIRFNLPKS